MGFDEAVEQLLKLYKGEPARPVQSRANLIIEDGMYIDRETGRLCGRHLDLDSNSGQYNPIYFYNRSWRFIGLFNKNGIHVRDQGKVLSTFEALERVWEKRKEKYERTYFLTQTLILQEIVRRLEIAAADGFVEHRPISDLRRYKAQIKIFNELWQEI